MNIEQAQALAMICHYAKEYLKDNKTMSQSVDIAQDIIKKELKALEIIKKYYVFEENQFYPFKRKNVTTCETKEENDLLKEVLL